MAIPYDDLMQIQSPPRPVAYGERETILYALGVGFGRDPVAEPELPFVCEHAGLKVVPTFASVFGRTRDVTDPAGIDYAKILHGEERLVVLEPAPPAGKLVMHERVSGEFDKGPGRGALLLIERALHDATSGRRLCTVTSTMFARGDGGFGGPRDGAPAPHRLPARAPDLVVESQTRADQALLFALSGDRNPLHRDPRAAKAAGYDRPILHGRCTYGVACRAILASVCDYDIRAITGFDARFSAPVLPGETIVTEAWIDGRIVAFRARSRERDAIVLDNGRCTLAG